MRERPKRYKRISDSKGFTLVELIVVLAILAILSSVAVFSIIGYIDKTRFDKNEQNAQSMYQAVQTSLERKKVSGEAEAWITDELMKKGVADPYSEANADKDASGNDLDKCYNLTAFDAFSETRNQVGDSVHMRYTLTHLKGGADAQTQAVVQLVGSYFYDTTILDATFTIEFDVEKTIGGDEKLHYGVNAYAVFYDEKNTQWNEKALQGGAVPKREYAYRRGESLVGYFNGGNPGAVDSVYTPAVENKMQFAELALRNGEELELTFSVFNGNVPVTGTCDEEGNAFHIHYMASIYDKYDDKKLADLVISESALMTGVPGGNGKPVDYRTLLDFQPGNNNTAVSKTVSISGTDYPVIYSVDQMKDDTGRDFIRYKASIVSTALVYVHKGAGAFDYNALHKSDLSGATDFYRFPLTVSYVIRKYSETEQKKYVSYSITLDAMMSRYAQLQYEKNASNELKSKTLSSSITRLFEDGYAAVTGKNQAPRNIYVSMTAAVDAFSDPDLAAANETKDLPASDMVKAKRAYDDPVYRLENGNYSCRTGVAIRDDESGYAVCNTLFGDLGTGSLGNKHDTQNAVITSFRHLYNMRYTTALVPETTESSKIVTYEIRRDLDWYRKEDDG
ncbi:MAG: type II secretion system GspH family protein, partial [Lachnospiraceae bacterium]|nr:type II secretion system GspH family protein [Lachnospiraceae bacterium]